MTITPRGETTPARQARNEVAAAARWGNRKAEAEARRKLKAELLAGHITRLVDSAPPLRPEQLARLRALLTPAPAGTAPVAIEDAA